MSLAPGTRIGAYEVVSLVGVGGMGMVYRARDTRLHRDAALKILPELFASDPDRLNRFEREARTLAALNHPHIGGIYGFEENGGVRALALEFVDGQTLAERIARGPIPIEEALSIARQIAEALEAAHDQGIIHRDLKPANIKVRNDGTVKVLDFGLAKALASDDGQAADAEALANSPTSTSAAMTAVGVVLGTAAYMSPEQAKGKPADKRSDIWAFGCVLYEMLTGRPAFGRPSVTETIGALLEREPDWSSIPRDTPAGIQHILRRTLAKDPKQRLRDIGDARLDLDPPVGTTPIFTDSGDQLAAKRWLKRSHALVLALIIAAAGAGAAAWLRLRSDPDATPVGLSRTTVVLPANQELDTDDGAAPLAISPDGARLAYVAYRGGSAHLYVRELDAFEPRRIEGTNGADYPFFSPDGNSIGFFADRKLKRVAIRGGAPIVVCEAPVVGRGATWGADGTIIFDPGQRGLMRVPATGGTPEPVRSADPEFDAQNLSWPQFLPNGRAVLATVAAGGVGEGTTIAVLSLATGKWARLLPGMQAQYAPSGHLLFHAAHVREGELHAVAFSAERLTISGMPAAVLDGVFRARDGGGAYFGISQSGVVIFALGSYARTLVRVDRSGRREPLLEERRGFRFPDLAPNGRQVAVTIDPRPSQVWVYDLARRSGTPLAAEGHNLSPLWTPDGVRLAYASSRLGNIDIHWRAADGSTPAAPLLQRELAQYPSEWSKDGQVLVLNTSTATDKSDIWMMRVGGEPQPLLATGADELNARLSPDERWLAYMSDESGRHEVYVRPFPDVMRQKWPVSTGGGHTPIWAHSGRELFYMSGAALMAVPVDGNAASFAAGRPTVLFTGPFDTTQDNNYDVSADDKFFVMIEADPDAQPTRVNIVQNWTEELKRLVSTK